MCWKKQTHPHWSKLLISHINPWTKILCSYIAAKTGRIITNSTNEMKTNKVFLCFQRNKETLNFWSSTIELFRIKPAQLVSHHRCKHTDCYYATVCNVLTEAQLEIAALWLFQEIPTEWSLPPLSQISFIIVQSSALKNSGNYFLISHFQIKLRGLN